jgi:hypothetical protein
VYHILEGISFQKKNNGTSYFGAKMSRATHMRVVRMVDLLQAKTLGSYVAFTAIGVDFDFLYMTFMAERDATWGEYSPRGAFSRC